MVSLLLAIIYMAFISLGLPDGLLGAAWPVARGDFGVPASYMGIVSMIIAACSILSSLLSDKVTRRMGAGPVTAVSVLLTAAALLGFSLSRSFWILCVMAVPYGLGAGAVDAALNNYVALHYSSRHMSWLHAFWGVGAAIGPYVMSVAIGSRHGWPMGYGTIAAVQVALTVVLFASLPLWKKRDSATTPDEDGYEAPLSLRQAVGIRGVKTMLLTFFGYCALEATAGLWAASYLVDQRGVDTQSAAAFAMLFYLGITAGRFLNGFAADRFGDRAMVRVGLTVQAAGLVLILLPTVLTALIGLVALGLGCAPIYPCCNHATPTLFGRENSHAIVGIQVAAAYCGITFIPPVFGLVAQHLHIGLFPLFLVVFWVTMVLTTERVNRMGEA
ncbi:MAG: MFS transporter [Ruminococcaceae bacterium]|nr:MFS transporter [Oscillospiraceae bacterium]